MVSDWFVMRNIVVYFQLCHGFRLVCNEKYRGILPVMSWIQNVYGSQKCCYRTMVNILIRTVVLSFELEVIKNKSIELTIFSRVTIRHMCQLGNNLPTLVKQINNDIVGQAFTFFNWILLVGHYLKKKEN